MQLTDLPMLFKPLLILTVTRLLLQKRAILILSDIGMQVLLGWLIRFMKHYFLMVILIFLLVMNLILISLSLFFQSVKRIWRMSKLPKLKIVVIYDLRRIYFTPCFKKVQIIGHSLWHLNIIRLMTAQSIMKMVRPPSMLTKRIAFCRVILLKIILQIITARQMQTVQSIFRRAVIILKCLKK